MMGKNHVTRRDFYSFLHQHCPECGSNVRRDTDLFVEDARGKDFVDDVNLARCSNVQCGWYGLVKNATSYDPRKFQPRRSAIIPSHKLTEVPQTCTTSFGGSRQQNKTTGATSWTHSSDIDVTDEVLQLANPDEFYRMKRKVEEIKIDDVYKVGVARARRLSSFVHDIESALFAIREIRKTDPNVKYLYNVKAHYGAGGYYWSIRYAKFKDNDEEKMYKSSCGGATYEEPLKDALKHGFNFDKKIASVMVKKIAEKIDEEIFGELMNGRKDKAKEPQKIRVTKETFYFNHRACPLCGATDLSTTFIEVPQFLTEDFVDDVNLRTCKCGWIGKTTEMRAISTFDPSSFVEPLGYVYAPYVPNFLTAGARYVDTKSWFGKLKVWFLMKFRGYRLLNPVNKGYTVWLTKLPPIKSPLTSSIVSTKEVFANKKRLLSRYGKVSINDSGYMKVPIT